MDFSKHYYKLCGTLPKVEINKIIRDVYTYLEVRYYDKTYQHCFPALENAIQVVASSSLSKAEMIKIIDTFAFHELGHIPAEYCAVLHELKQQFLLAAVIDIWAPKKPWVETFERQGIRSVFSALSFSSDHGMVKPSPKPFERIMQELCLSKEDCLVIGDSVRRDLGGAKAGGIDCVLVGGANDSQALDHFPNLLDLCNEI